MAEGTSPGINTQSSTIPETKCQLCGIHDIQFKCLTCVENNYMCNICKRVHTQNAATCDHIITLTEDEDQREVTGTDTSKCLMHPTEDIVMYCQSCIYPVCLHCLANRSHQNHQLAKIQDIIREKQKELSKIIDDANTNLSTAKNQMNSIKKMANEYSNEIRKCMGKIKARNVQLKSMLDQITNNAINKLQRKEKQHQDELKKTEIMVAENISSLKEMIKNFKKKQEKREAELVRFTADMRKKLGQVHMPIQPMTPKPPVFVIRDVNAYELQVLFGDLDPEGFIRTTTRVTLRAKPTIDVKEISTFSMSKVLVATVSDSQAWLGKWSYRDICLVTSNGNIVKTINADFHIHDMAVTKTGELLVTVWEGNKVKKLKPDGKFADIYIAAAECETRGITVTDENHIIVCLYVRDQNHGQLVRLSSDGSLLHTIEYNADSTPMFSENLYSVSSNINGDLVIIDGKVVVILDKMGHRRLTYKGEVRGLKKAFNPWYTTSDEYGHILVSDHTNNTVHLLDIEGKFLQFLLTNNHQLEGPWGLSIDISGRLWVCSVWNDKVKVVKYL